MAKDWQKTQIDWNEVEKLMSYQCTQEEVAHFFGISLNTLERYCEKDHGIKLGEFWNKKRALGRVKLRKLQFGIIERGGHGAASMAIWLDKKMFPDERPDQPAPPEKTQPVDNSKPIKKTFGQFCLDSGYPEPFEKQIEMMNFGMHETATRLLLGSRGYGKTDYVTVLGVAYDIYCDWFDSHMENRPPTATNLIISKSKTRNSSMINEIATALVKNGVTLEKENASCIRVAGLIGKDDTVEALPLKASFRGRHPKLIVMDDPVTEEDTSEAQRKLVKKKYDEAYKLCKNICIIGQPAHAFDLYAELRDILKKLEVPHGSIPQLDADLEAMRLAGIDAKSIEMSYHLRVPVDGSTPFSKIKYIDQFPVGDSVAFIDPSEGGDYTAISVVKSHFNGVVVEGYAWQRAWYHCIDELTEIVKRLGVKKVAFETNKFGNQPVFQLREAWKSMQIGVVGKHSDSNKHAIIMNAGSYSHLIHLSKKSQKIYTSLVVQYEYGAKFDDPPDSLARCLEWIGLIK